MKKIVSVSAILAVTLAFLIGINSDGAMLLGKDEAFLRTTASIAPSATSTDYSDWRANALFALQHDLDQNGSPGPSYYEASNLAYVSDIIGMNGYSDRSLVFNTAITSDKKVKLSDLTYEVSGTDPLHKFDQTVSFASFEYSLNYVGVLLDKDGGIKSLVTSGPSSRSVDALYVIGAPCWINTGTQEEYGLASQYVIGNTPFNITGTYSMEGVSSSFTVAVVPEPEQFVFLSGIFLLIFGGIRRKYP